MDGINRFIDKQKVMYAIAFQEIKSGRKKTHWMWYIFPQIKGLGSSSISQYFAIKDKKEALEFFDNEYLRCNYLRLCELLIESDINNPIQIFGEVDSLKLHSSLTLFYLISGNPIIHHTLEKFFELELDTFTIERLSLNLNVPISIQEKIEYLNISNENYELINSLNMLDIIKKMISEHNDINLCLQDMKYVLSKKNIIGYVLEDANHDLIINYLSKSKAQHVLLCVYDKGLNLKQYETKFINCSIFYCYKKSKYKNIVGLIFD